MADQVSPYFPSYLKAELTRWLITHWNNSCHPSRCHNVGGSGGTCRHLQGTSAGCSWGYTCRSPGNTHRRTTDTGSWCHRMSNRSYHRLHTSHLCSHRNRCHQLEHWLRQKMKNKKNTIMSVLQYYPVAYSGQFDQQRPWWRKSVLLLLEQLMQLSLLSAHESQFGEHSSHSWVAELAKEPDGHCSTQEPSWSRKFPVAQINKLIYSEQSGWIIQRRKMFAPLKQEAQSSACGPKQVLQDASHEWHWLFFPAIKTLTLLYTLQKIL